MSMPVMIPVESSNVHSIGYAANELHVRFKSGGHYIYQGTNADLFERMKASDSIGKFIGAHVKGRHQFRKLDETAAAE